MIHTLSEYYEPQMWLFLKLLLPLLQEKGEICDFKRFYGSFLTIFLNFF